MCSSTDLHNAHFFRVMVRAVYTPLQYYKIISFYRLQFLPQELPEGEWFCSNDCGRIHSSLQELLHGSQPLQDANTNIIKKKCEEKGIDKSGDDVKWRLLSGKTSPADVKLLLSEAVTIFHVSIWGMLASINN